MSQPPLQPSIHRVQIPDIGATFDRLNVPIASLAFGCLRFIKSTINLQIISLGGRDPPRGGTFCQNESSGQLIYKDFLAKRGSGIKRGGFRGAVPPYLRGFDDGSGPVPTLSPTIFWTSTSLDEGPLLLDDRFEGVLGRVAEGHEDVSREVLPPDQIDEPSRTRLFSWGSETSARRPRKVTNR